MRAFVVHDAELQLGLANVPAQLEPAVVQLGFEPAGSVFVRRFAGDAPYAAAAAEHFEACAERMVLQAARFEPVPWRAALEEVLARVEPDGWWLAGSAALAVRGVPVAPRDIDLISDADGCARLADALADDLVEPLVDGGWLGERWFRAFVGGARVECVGGVHATHDKPVPSDFGPVAAARLATVHWRGWTLHVPPLELQLASRQRRGLA